MNKLPIELFSKISNNFTNYRDLLVLKYVCKEFNNYIDNFLLIKIKLQKKIILQNKKKLQQCVNPNCYCETKDLFINYYREFEGFYRHCHQPSMNYDTIYINSNEYKVFSPYCCECFKKYILEINKNKNYYDYLIEGFVDINFKNSI